MFQRAGSLLRRGFVAGPVVIVVLVLGGVAIVVITIAGNLRNPGGSPHSLHLGPPGVVLHPNVPATIDVALVLNHPLPNPTAALTWTVNIDEDDPTFDDELHSAITVTFNAGDAYATGSFQVVCRNLRANNVFDLHPVPAGGEISDENEAVHHLHAEGPGDNSANIVVTCAPPRTPASTTQPPGG